MPPEVTQILTNWGMGAPLLYVGAVFGIFAWLDRKASNEARLVLASRLSSISYDRKAISAAIVEMFDRVYTNPLLTWKEFGRSAWISTAVTFVAFLNFGWWLSDLLTSDVLITHGLIPLISNILSDYISLLVVRWWLATNWKSPLVQITIGSLIGAIIVFLLYLVRLWFGSFVGDWILNWDNPFMFSIKDRIHDAVGSAQAGLWVTSESSLADKWNEIRSELVLAAVAVHLWLPLFGVGIAVIRTARYLSQPVVFIQWFLDQGDKHPYEAVGYVVATLVFILGAIVHWVL